jgi:hypothetical protein
MTLLEAALQYALRGWPVFPLHNMHQGQCTCGQPCKSRAKHPRTRTGFKDASTDDQVIRGWWSKWPEANIGIATGDRSFVVVDLDTKEHDGIQAFNDLRDSNIFPGSKMAQTLIAKTGGGGMHLCFEPHADVRNTQSKLALGIDTRGEGGYIVAPPSVHESGEAYKWLSPHDTPLSPIPEWLVPRKPRRAPTPPPAVPTSPVPVDQVTQRASAYLQRMEPAIQGSGGHGALYAAATVLVHGFDLPDYQAIQLLTNEFNPRCVPPWDLSIPAESKDFRRKVSQARAQDHDQPRGWLLADSGYTEASPSAVEHGRTVAESILRNSNVATSPPAEPIVYQDEPECGPVALPEMPSHLLSPPGYIGQLVKWMNDTAYMPQPILSLANALAFFGAVIGRKVRDESDLRTNLYCLGVGESGCGKDHSRKCVKKLCKMAGIDGDILGGEDIASDAAILSAVEARPSVLFQFDEIGHLLANTSSRQAATYQKAIPVTLTKLFSSASTTYLGKEYAGKERERIDIDQPNVCLYGTTVPDRFFEGITTAEVRDGFLGRMLVFQSTDPDPEPRSHVVSEVPVDLVETVQSWIKKKIEVPGANLLPFLIAQQMVIRLDPESTRIFAQFQRHARDTRMKARKANNPAAACLWSRSYENARKIALTIAAGDGLSNQTITGQHAEYAIQLVTFLVERLIQSVADNVADNETERAKAKIMAFVGRHGGKVAKSTLTRNIRVSRRFREDALKDLLEGEELAIISEINGGRPGIKYCFPSIIPGS